MSFFYKISDNKILRLKQNGMTKKLSGSSCFDYVNDEVVKKEKKEFKKIANVELPTMQTIASDLENWFNSLSINEQLTLELSTGSHCGSTVSLATTKNEETNTDKKKYTLNKKLVQQRLFAYFNTEDSQKRLHFITITFPERLNEELVYKYFNVWLTRIRSELKINSYLWVVEKQQNGTLHFHMFVNQYIEIKEANRFMKETLVNGRAKKEFRYALEKLENYNGIDIAKQTINGKRTKKIMNFAKSKSLKSVRQYITKYIVKNKTEFSRATWRCSQNISALFTSTNLNLTSGTLKTIFQKFKFKKTFTNEYAEIHFCEDMIKTSDVDLLLSINNLLWNSM